MGGDRVSLVKMDQNNVHVKTAKNTRHTVKVQDWNRFKVLLYTDPKTQRVFKAGERVDVMVHVKAKNPDCKVICTMDDERYEIKKDDYAKYFKTVGGFNHKFSKFISEDKLEVVPSWSEKLEPRYSANLAEKLKKVKKELQNLEDNYMYGKYEELLKKTIVATRTVLDDRRKRFEVSEKMADLLDQNPQPNSRTMNGHRFQAFKAIHEATKRHYKDLKTFGRQRERSSEFRRWFENFEKQERKADKHAEIERVFAEVRGSAREPNV